MSSEKIDIGFEIMNFFFKIFTFGYVAEIIIGFFVLILIVSVLFLFSDSRVIMFHVKDKNNFIKKYLSEIVREKSAFIKDWVRIFKNKSNFKVIMFWFCAILLIGSIILYSVLSQ